MVVPLSQVYIDMIKAFRADCETLIGKFKNEKNNFRHTFIQLWKSSAFHLVYDDRCQKNGLEHDFKNDTLQIAKLIMLQDHFPSGMFLMFSLYCLQDCPQGSIRLELDEYRQIIKMLRLKHVSPAVNNSELGKIFCILLKEDAFEFVAFSREYDMEGQHRAAMIYDNQYEFYDDEGPKYNESPEQWLDNIMKHFPKMKDLQSKYFMMRTKVKEAFPSLNLSMDMVQEDIMTTLLKALNETDSDTKPLEAQDNIGSRRWALKNRKMKIKYRYQLDRNDEECPSQPKRKRKGCPKGERKFFFKKAIDHPKMDYGSETEDSIGLDPNKMETKQELPKIDD